MAEESASSRLKAFFYTGLFCLGIGVTNWMIDTGVPLWASLAVSFSIGWSINLSFMLLEEPFHRYLSPYLAPIPITAVGLFFGLILGGTFVVRDPWFFFTESYITLVMGVFFGIVGFLLFSTRGRLLQAQAELAEANAERARQEKLVTETELKLLQAQIEPHFLFNTLSNVVSLIHASPATAEKMLVNLTTLLRATLDRTREQTTTLAQELEIATAYLDIQATRMQDRLTYTMQVEPGLEQISLPPLIVQPLIENAIKHGIDPSEQGGQIDITVARNDAYVEIVVQDNGVGISTASQANQRGTGISNVRERLQLLYDQATLTLVEPPGGGVRAELRLPYEGQAGID